MAKKQNVKKSLPKKSDGLNFFWNKHWQVILIVVLAFGILGFIGVNKLIIYNQKQQFDQAEKSLDTLYANIVKDVGQPTSMNKDKSCSYASTEGGRGRRGCGSSYSLTYISSSLDQANMIKKSIISSAKKIVNVTYSQSAEFKNNQNTPPGDEEALDFKCPGKLNCSLSVSFRVSDDKSATSSSVHVEFAAGGDAKAEFYPVKN